MLIDRSYFVGELNIVTKNDGSQERLDWFIEKYERILLRKVLGAPMYSAFIAGLLSDPVAQKWVSLLQGADRWLGFVENVDGGASAALLSTIPVIVGRGELYDPLSGSFQTTIPPALVGTAFEVEQRGVGTLGADEYVLSGNTLTLNSGHIFSLNDRYFYRPKGLFINQDEDTLKESVIANYVYFMYMQDLVTTTSAIGENKAKAENSTRIAPADKMARAWNEMSCKLRNLWDYLDLNALTYGYQPHHCNRNEFRTINTFGI